MTAIVLTAVALLIALLAAGGFVRVAYKKHWTWTGFVGEPPDPKGKGATPPKRLWDWLDLLAVPLVLAVAVTGIGYVQSLNEASRADRRADVDREIALDAQRERTLQDYLDAMTALMLEEDLQVRSDDGVTPAQRVAVTRTLAALRSLDAERKGIVVQFLADSDLLQSSFNVEDESYEPPILQLKGADLQGVQLEEACLGSVDLEGADLTGADLSGAFMDGASLFGADLSGAMLRSTALQGADLSEANLTQTDLTGADLTHANFYSVTGHDTSLLGANLQEASGDIGKLIGPKLENAVVSPNTELNIPGDAEVIVEPWGGAETGRGAQCFF